MLFSVYNDEQLWTKRIPVIEDTDWKLGADTIKAVIGLGYEYRDKFSVLIAMYDLMNVINPLWVDKRMVILRKDKNGNIIKENPYNKNKS